MTPFQLLPPIADIAPLLPVGSDTAQPTGGAPGADGDMSEDGSDFALLMQEAGQFQHVPGDGMVTSPIGDMTHIGSADMAAPTLQPERTGSAALADAAIADGTSGKTLPPVDLGLTAQNRGAPTVQAAPTEVQHGKTEMRGSDMVEAAAPVLSGEPPAQTPSQSGAETPRTGTSAVSLPPAMQAAAPMNAPAPPLSPAVPVQQAPVPQALADMGGAMPQQAIPQAVVLPMASGGMALHVRGDSGPVMAAVRTREDAVTVEFRVAEVSQAVAIDAGRAQLAEQMSRSGFALATGTPETPTATAGGSGGASASGSGPGSGRPAPWFQPAAAHGTDARPFSPRREERHVIGYA